LKYLMEQKERLKKLIDELGESTEKEMEKYD
jgi:hypothetical protein